MNKCSAVEMRKNMVIVEGFKNAGFDFVAIPAKDENHKKELIAMLLSQLDNMGIIEIANNE